MVIEHRSIARIEYTAKNQLIVFFFFCAVCSHTVVHERVDPSKSKAWFRLFREKKNKRNVAMVTDEMS